MFDNCPLRYKRQRVLKEVRDQGGEASLRGERIHKSVEEYLANGTPLDDESKKLSAAANTIKKMAGKMDMKVEQELTINNKLGKTGWWDDDAWFRSKIDVLLMGKTKAVMFDWKTGKRRPDYTQLNLFSMMVFLHYPDIEEVTSAFVWMNDNAIDKTTHDRRQLPALVKQLLVKTHRIEDAQKEDVWPAKPSGLCPWCPCKSTCEFAK